MPTAGCARRSRPSGRLASRVRGERPCAGRALRYRAATAERRWSGSDFRQYGQWRYQRVGVPSPGPTGNRLASVGDTAFRAARSRLPGPEQEAPLPLRAGYCDEGPRKRPLTFLPEVRSGRDALGRCNGFRRERRQVQPELLEHLAVEQSPFAIEPLVRTRDRDLRPDDAGPGDPEDPLQILLGPEGAELAGARADDGDRLVPQHCLEAGPRGPVDRVLQAPGNGA